MRREPSFLRSPVALAAVLGASLVAAPARAQVIEYMWYGQDYALFGLRIANAGDVDADGTDDVIVAETDYTGRSHKQGRVSVFSGATHALIRSHLGPQADDEFGISVTGIGDVNSDHCSDYAIGADDFSSNGLNSNGRVTVFSGKDGSVLWSVDGTSTAQHLGTVVVGIDDVDGDKKPDLLIGDMWNSKAYVYSSNGTLIYTLQGASGSFQWCTSAAACGDLDGDGVRDFVIGDPYYTPTSTFPYPGAAHAFSAKTGTELFLFAGQNGDQLGRHVAGLGDIDGDGIPDLAMSNDSAAGTGVYRGSVIVASGADGSKIWSNEGEQDWEQIGSALIGLGDFDRDGVDDYAVGAMYGGLNGQGLVRIYSGATGGKIFEWVGTTTTLTRNNLLGSALAAGDFNHDGIADLVTGDALFDQYDPVTAIWSRTGGAFVYYGCPAYEEIYGAGWPGKNGVPSLYTWENPVVGGPLDVYVGNSLGSRTIALLFVGLAEANIPTGKGGTLLVDPALYLTVPVDAAGTTLSGQLPNDPSLYFADLYLQAIESDPYASRGTSFTAGLHLRFGYDVP
jgi:VCBS repeat protein/FG-GAP repeat protein